MKHDPTRPNSVPHTWPPHEARGLAVLGAKLDAGVTPLLPASDMAPQKLGKYKDKPSALV